MPRACDNARGFYIASSTHTCPMGTLSLLPQILEKEGEGRVRVIEERTHDRIQFT
jgi:hypothetical protein